MWLFIPSPYVPASADLTLGSELPDPTRAASLTWRGKQVPPPRWSLLWRRGGFIRLLSGLTCEVSTLEHGAAQWIASCRATRAKATASPESDLAPTMTAGCSTARSRCSIKAGLRISSVRTSRGTRTDSSPLPSRHWKDWAAALRSEFSARARPERATAASDCSSWPTAKTLTGGANSNREARGAGGPDLQEAVALWTTPSSDDTGTQTKKYAQGGTALSMQADQWATPQARDHFPAHSPDYVAAKKVQGHGMRNLNDEAAQWASPRASDGEKGGPNQRGSKGDMMLPSQAAHWPTPAARDHKGTNSPDHITTNGTGRMHMDQMPNFVKYAFHPSPPDHPTPAGPPSSPPRRRLNPLFVEWLMGWPTGLSGFDTAAMASCLSPPPSPGCGCMHCWLTTQRAMLSALLTVEPPPQGRLL